MKRESWIDAVKAICMIAVYLLHSEAYYGIGDIAYGYVLKPFYVNAFFFVSGHLFINRYLPFLTDLRKITLWKKKERSKK